LVPPGEPIFLDFVNKFKEIAAQKPRKSAKKALFFHRFCGFSASKMLFFATKMVF
jgi:hypothetical protein